MSFNRSRLRQLRQDWRSCSCCVPQILVGLLPLLFWPLEQTANTRASAANMLAINLTLASTVP
jgi:DUF1680 family protein